MVVPVYSDRKGRFSFFKPRGRSTALKVEVPEGSELLQTKLLGPQLFVPAADELQMIAWDAAAIVKAAREGGRGFRLA